MRCEKWERSSVRSKLRLRSSSEGQKAGVEPRHVRFWVSVVGGGGGAEVLVCTTSHLALDEFQCFSGLYCVISRLSAIMGDSFCWSIGSYCVLSFDGWREDIRGTVVVHSGHEGGNHNQSMAGHEGTEASAARLSGCLP